jgi:AcrR family transcriptional regulator
LREAIIETSVQLGSELGEEGLTMRGIAARLGVSATALYQHFESKRAILREIRVHGISLMYSSLAPAFDIAEHEERLAEINRRYVVFARENQWLYTVLMEHEQHDWSKLGAEELADTIKPLTAVRQAIRKGVEAGVWRKDLDIDSAAFQMWAAIHGLCSLMIAKRITEDHPAFPVRDEAAFIESFVRNLVRTCTS